MCSVRIGLHKKTVEKEAFSVPVNSGGLSGARTCTGLQ